MNSPQRIVRERRQYNQWVASQTLEDYALRYTADSARKSSFRVGNTALGPIAFLACEAIGGALTISYGFPNTAWAIGSFMVVMFLIGLPIAYYAAKYGVDIDLLTRGAGFGYLGSTLTSLIYASFTFLLFSIEASILSVALQMLFGIPLAAAHVLSSLVVIPIAVYGISLISRVQLATQPIWLALQFLPIAYIVWRHPAHLSEWTHYAGTGGGSAASINLPMLGMAASTLLSLLPQIGEQVDYLRFLPARDRRKPFSWWTALLATGPGWVIIGGFKLFAGSFLTVLALHHGASAGDASQPTRMYLVAFQDAMGSPTAALVLTGLLVIVCQLKINVTNAYAGSIAWSNFFSRLTHSHPGRVVWLVFNVVLALVLMETGILSAIDGILRIYANFAAGWIGALTADLVINKPLGLSPPYIEFRRAYLYDVNPVGVGRADSVHRRLQLGVPRRLRLHAADTVALCRAADRLRGGAPHCLGHVRALLPGSTGRRHAARHQYPTLLHLREFFRACRYGALSGLLRTHMFPVLHIGITLSGCLQATWSHRQSAHRGSHGNASAQIGSWAQHARRSFRRHRHSVQPAYRAVVVHHLPRIRRHFAGGPGECTDDSVDRVLESAAVIQYRGVVDCPGTREPPQRRSRIGPPNSHAHGGNRGTPPHRCRATACEGNGGIRQSCQDPLHRRGQSRDSRTAQFDLRLRATSRAGHCLFAGECGSRDTPQQRALVESHRRTARRIENREWHPALEPGRRPAARFSR
jgi:hypothetical protein